ncbi:MAG: AtpZ/AtpI family protein [Planctomycetota bacterium]|nr:AtpZ/AtpI family protein [Planctomycetota bacterium]
MRGKPNAGYRRDAGGTEKPDDAGNGSGNRDLWRYLGLGTQLAVTVAVFVGLGWWLDQRYGWTPWGILTLGTLGVAAGLYHFLKETMK